MTTLAQLEREALSAETLAQLFTQAHTANSFSEEPVTDAELLALQELTALPPTAMNIQPLRVLWVRSEEGKARLGALMSEGNRDKTLAAPLAAVLASDANWHEHLETLAPFRLDAKDSFAANEPMRSGMAAMNAHLQAGYFILAARALGLDAGPMGGFDKSGVDREFFSENGWKSFMVVNLGHPAADGAGYRPRAGRLGFEEQTLTV